MSVKYEVTAVTGKYTDRDGNEKNRYAKIGIIVPTKNGYMLKMESVPLGWDGWAYLNEPKERQAPAAQPRQQSMGQWGSEAKGGIADMDDDIPF